MIVDGAEAAKNLVKIFRERECEQYERRATLNVHSANFRGGKKRETRALATFSRRRVDF